jgi:hypothetical protein
MRFSSSSHVAAAFCVVLAGVIWGGPILGSPAPFIFAFARIGGTPARRASLSRWADGTSHLVAYSGRRRHASCRLS